tara:strand:+ start:1978 stop:8079 length:6102 start_codon:yes stop_codon:yes gene_type:complete
MAGIPQVITEDRASGAQFIDGSVRFEKERKKHLKRTPPSLGNQKTWTLSFWFKKQNMGDQRILFNSFTDNSNRVIVRFMSDKLQFALQTGGTFYGLQTNQVFRDNGWYHVVLILDTTQPTDIDRQKIYVNGNQIADSDLTHNSISGSNKYPTQNSTFNFNSRVAHYIAGNNESGSVQDTTFDGQITNVNLVDGLALGPGYFAFTDPLTGTWRPKKFQNSGTTANDGTVWTNTMSGTSLIYSGAAANAFNGNPTPWTTDNYFSFNVGTITLLSGVNVTARSKIRIYGNWMASDYIVVNGANYLTDADGTQKWISPKGLTYPLNLTSLAVNTTPGNVQNSLSAVEIDGVIMKDSTTEYVQFGTNGFYLPLDGNAPIGKNQAPSEVNNGTTWSSNLTSTQNFNLAVTRAFDGDTSTLAATANATNANILWTQTISNVRTLRVYMDHDYQNYRVRVNGGSWYVDDTLGATANADWRDLTSLIPGNGTITSIESDTGGLNNGVNWSAVEINGDILVDGATDKGNDYRPVNFGGSVSIDNPIATGARPILNSLGGTTAKPGVFGSEAGATYKTTSLTNSTGKYYFAHDPGTAAPSFNFIRGATYVFDNTIGSTHTLRLSTTSNGTWGGGSVYTDGVETFGNFTVITVPHDAPSTLYYFCTVHTGMGGSINVTTDETKADLYASSLVLACPYAGDREDVSNQINCTVSSKGSDNYGSVQTIKDGAFYGGARFFDGSDDNINYSSSSSLGLPGAFTLEMYATPTSISDGAPISSKGYYYQNGNWYLKFTTQSGGKIQFYSYSPGTSNGQTNDITGTGTDDPTKIHHIVCQRDSSNLMSFMIDGVLVGQGSNVTHNLTDGASNGVTVGRMAQNGSSNAAHVWYGGYISDLRIYKGITKYDVSGKSTGDQIFIPASAHPDIIPDTPSGLTVKSKVARSIGGSASVERAGNEYLQAPASTDFRLDGQYCIEYFLNLSDYSNDSVYVRTFVLDGPTGDGGSTNIHLNVNPDTGKILFWSGSGELISGTISVAGGWHHVCLTRDSSNITRLFVDGVLSGSATITTDYNLNSNQNRPRLGALGDTGGTTGHYSNWRITKGSIPFDYQTASSTTGERYFVPPTEPLTTTSQGATANDVKLLALQSVDFSMNAAAVSPNLAGAVNDGKVWSDFTSSLAGFSGGAPKQYAFNGDTSNKASTNSNTGYSVTGNDKNAIEFVPPSPIPYSSDIKVIGRNTGQTTMGVKIDTGSGYGSEIALGNDNLQTVVSGSGNLVRMKVYTKTYSGENELGGIQIDGVYLTDPVSPYGGATPSSFNPFNDVDTARGKSAAFATWDPVNGHTLSAYYTLDDNNLYAKYSGGTSAASGARGFAVSNYGMSTGKYYFELDILQQYNDDHAFGIATNTGDGYYLGDDSWTYRASGQKFMNGTLSYGQSWVAGDVMSASYDADKGELICYKNGISQGVLVTGLTGEMFWVWGADAGGNSSITYQVSANFGQKPFRFTPPDGFQPLTSPELRPDIVVPHPKKYVNVATYTGNGASSPGGSGGSQDINVGHKPDLIWIKDRGQAGHNNNLIDSVNGAPNLWMSDNPTALDTTSTDGVTAITDTGFTLGDNGTGTQSMEMNKSGNTYVAWTWKAGGNAGTFNVDDVDVGSAANANMSVGSLTNVAYNKASLWRNNWTASGNGFGSAPVSHIFDASFKNYCNNNAGGQIITWDTSSYSLSGKLRIRCSGQAYYIYVNGVFILRPPNNGEETWVNLGNFKFINEIQFGGDTYNTNNNLGSAGANIYQIEVDGKVLIDSDVSIDSPSMAATACSVGTEQGFSIIKYAGAGSGSANTDSDKGFPHGLSQAPDFVITKNLDSSNAPQCYHSGIPHGAMNLASTNGNDTSSFLYAKRHPSAQEVFLGNNPEINATGNNYISYCWHNVPGLQKFGTYAGRDGANGPVIDLGFRPRILLLKRYSSDHSNAGWHWYDSARDTYNPAYRFILADKDYVETRAANNSGNVSSYYVDFLSNGFKLRHDSTNLSVSGQSYLYCAWAEAPAFNLFGAQSNAR